MNKKIVAVVLILLTGSAWGYLAYLDGQQKQEAVEARKAMEQAKTEARARFDAMLRSDLSACLAAAEKASVSDKAMKKLAEDKAACQLTYDTRMTHGW